MNLNTLRSRFIDFFTSESRRHKRIPSAPLISVGDSSTLFTSAGMQPLVPFLLGEKHPMGKRLVNSQLSFRSEDINEVGDNRHTTFFEMLGNWSLGGYFKKEQLSWFFEFLTQIVELDPARLFVTVFEGNEFVSKDQQSIDVWQKLFKTNQSARPGRQGFDPKIKIYYYPAKKNWWSRSGKPENMPAGEIGGPDSEVFFDFDPKGQLKIHENSKFAHQSCHLNCDCGRFLEIGNSVFIEYQKQKDGSLKQLSQKNVDFGGGLERILAAHLDQPDVFKTDAFWPIIKEIEKSCHLSYQQNKQDFQIIADHIKAAVFMINEGLKPSNKKEGYILRRLLRRAAVKMFKLKDSRVSSFSSICYQVLKIYEGQYFKTDMSLRDKISQTIDQEMDTFAKSLDKGLKRIEKASDKELNTLFAFDLFQTYGFPIEISQEIFSKRNKTIDRHEFERIYKHHQKLSRTASAGMFKSGLANHSEQTTKLHTATHLIHQALRNILGSHVKQVGSNITAKRLRFDFTHHKPVSNQEIKQIENLVNKKIKENLLVKCQTMKLTEAKESGALAFFEQKYPDKVKVYTIGEPAFSKELCTGPHVGRTSEIGLIEIFKEKSCGAGKRRIYAKLKTS